jgi:hypothetical protein
MEQDATRAAEVLPAPGERTAARRKRAAPRTPLRITLLRYAAAITGVLLVLAGIAWYIERRTSDPSDVREMVRRAVEGGRVLEPNETIEARASLMQRSWWDYYRPTPTTVLATDRRIVVLMVSPRVLPPAAWDPVSPSIEQRSFPYDSIAANLGRVFFGTDRGLILRVRSTGERIPLSAYPGQDSSMRSIVELVRKREEEKRVALERERQLQRLADMRSKEAIYHVIQRGEAVSSIADLYSITPERLRQLNSLPNDRIRVGDSLLVKPADP